MIKFFFIFLFSVAQVLGQNTGSNSAHKENIASEKNSNFNLKALISLKDGNIKLKGESKRIISDSIYRKLVFREVYTYNDVMISLKASNIRRAIWCLVNLYETQPELSKYILLHLVSAGVTQQHLLNSFYSYIALDTEIADYSTGVPVLIHPEVVNLKMNNFKKMISFLNEYKNINHD